MKRNVWAVMTNGRIEMWPPLEPDGVEQMEVFATREWAEKVRDLYIARMGSNYKVVPFQMVRREEEKP